MAPLTWALCWLSLGLVVPPLVHAHWLPPQEHPVWLLAWRRLMRWPLFSLRARLVVRARHRRQGWAQVALQGLDLAFWPWLLLAFAWETRRWRDEDEDVPGSEEPPVSRRRP